MNDLACKEFCKHISHTFKADLQDSLRAAKFISIMADEATDVSCLEEKIVYMYVRFVSGGAIKFAMDTIDPQWMQKLISTGTDGASVMMGKNGGVISLIKQDAPQLIGIHCVAHNLEVAFSDTLKSNEA